MKLYYIWDAYCGWCHGFGAVLEPFVANHPELDIEILSGGLFDRGNPISAYPHIPDANREIAKRFGVSFGPAYETLLATGTHLLDSRQATAGFSILKQHLAKQDWLAASKALQNAFYHEGKSLSDPATYAAIAAGFGMDSSAIATQVEEAFAAGTHLEDIAAVRALGVSSYPTLLLHKEGKWYDLRQGAMTLEALEEQFATLAG